MVDPGDWATVAADGSITLLGRGSVSINTGGEKVYPEEVEEALKLLDSVIDANVVGVPDPKWGSAVTAIVQLAEGATVTDATWSTRCGRNSRATSCRSTSCASTCSAARTASPTTSGPSRPPRTPSASPTDRRRRAQFGLVESTASQGGVHDPG